MPRFRRRRHGRRLHDAQPVQRGEIAKFDDDTTFRITDTDDGFRILREFTKNISGGQAGGVRGGCRDRLVTIAWEYADGLKRKIVEIDTFAIRVDSGRNILTGVTTCTATYKVK